MKRKILSLILAAACFTAAGCAEIKETPNSSAESSLSESSSEQSSAFSDTYSSPAREQSTSSNESSPISSAPDSSSSPASSSTPVSLSKPASSSKQSSSSKPVISSSIPVSSSAPKPSAPNEQNPPQNPEIIGNYNQRAAEAWEIEFANEVFRLTNIERVKAGLPELKQRSSLDNAALTRTWECLVQYGHTRPDGRKFSSALTEAGVGWQSCGENIAAGQQTPQDVVNAWMNSPGHYANIMNPDYEYLGVGFYYDYDKSGGTSYRYFWVQNFCK